MDKGFFSSFSSLKLLQTNSIFNNKTGVEIIVTTQYHVMKQNYDFSSVSCSMAGQTLLL